MEDNIRFSIELLEEEKEYLQKKVDGINEHIEYLQLMIQNDSTLLPQLTLNIEGLEDERQYVLDQIEDIDQRIENLKKLLPDECMPPPPVLLIEEEL